MKFILRLLTVVLFVLTAQCVQAQAPPQQGPPPIGSVIGIVSDTLTGQKIEYASVAIVAVADSAVKGGSITGADGSFSVSKLPPGNFRIRITFMGYKEWYSAPFTISMMKTQYDAGAIKLKTSDTELGTVVIEEQRSDYTNNIDKKVYDVTQNITNTGGSATEILQNIPSITVDVDGKVSLRGSENVTILIDGKPSGVTGEDRNAVLQQIPASMIERVEVITNPSAKYDAQGMAGIINIVLKKEKGKGYNGTLGGGVGTGNKYNGSVNLNMRREKANFFGSYAYRYEDRWGTSFGMQTTTTPDSAFKYGSTGGNIQSSTFHNARIGTDVYINPYNTLSVSAGYSFKNELRADSTNYQFYDESNTLTSDFSRRVDGYDRTHTIETGLDFRKSFPGSHKTFSSAASFSTNQREVGNYFRLNTIGYEASPYQTNFANNQFYIAVGQIDYSHPIHDSLKIETGAKYTFRQYMNEQAGYQYNYNSNEYISDWHYADVFTYVEQVAAGYVQGNMHRNHWDFLGGVRAEFTNLNGSSQSQDTTFTKQYLGLFPNIATRYTTTGGTEMQLSYGRRLNRPGNGQLNPYIDYSDSINLRTGNPYLNPEFIHSFDFTIARSKQKLSWSFTFYYRHSNNVISHMRTFDVATNRALVRPVNFTSSDNYGVEYVLRVPFAKKGNVMLSGSAYMNSMNGDNIEPALQSEAFHYNARVSFTYKIFKPTTVQISGMYFSPFIGPVGQFWMKGGIDVGIRQDVFKGKGQLSANLTDIINTREFEFRNERVDYKFIGGRKRESMVLMLSFTWRFGSNDEITKRKTQNVMPAEEMPGGGF